MGGRDDGSGTAAAADIPIFGNGEDAEGSVEEGEDDAEEAPKPSGNSSAKMITENYAAAAADAGPTKASSVATAAAAAADVATPRPMAGDNGEVRTVEQKPSDTSALLLPGTPTTATAENLQDDHLLGSSRGSGGSRAAAPNITGERRQGTLLQGSSTGDVNSSRLGEAGVAEREKDASVGGKAGNGLVAGRTTRTAKRTRGGDGGGDGGGQTKVSDEWNGSHGGLEKDALDKKTKEAADSAVAQLEDAASHSVDCLLFIKW